MGIIKPSAQGKSYSMWKLLLNFSLISMGHDLDEDTDPGFRVAIVVSCWIAIESILRECLIETIHTTKDKLPLTCEVKYKKNICEWVAKLFKCLKDTLNRRNKNELELKDEFVNKVKAYSWYDLLKKCELLNKKIENEITSWDFLVNLYRFRNGLTHGQSIKIMKSHVEYLNDEISKEYIKSINYLNGKRVIDKQRLIDKQDIKDLLNKSLTDFIINQTYTAIDDIIAKFPKTFISTQWQGMRKY